MKKSNLVYAFVILVVNLGISAWFTYQLHLDSLEYKQEKTNIASILSFEERLLDVKEAIPIVGDIEWYLKSKKLDKELSNIERTNYQSKLDIYGLLAINLISILILLIIYRKNILFFLTFSTLMVALVCYLGGILAPMLEIEAYKEDLAIKLELDPHDALQELTEMVEKLPFVGESLSKQLFDFEQSLPEEPIIWEKVYPGKMYFFYQNKSVLDVLSTLWTQKNFPIAILIIAFTFFIPILKISLTFILLLLPKRELKTTSKLIHFLTKFSMVDVMVIALFITFFSFQDFGAGVSTDSNVLEGAYLFSGYVLFAILSGVFLDRYKLKLKNQVI